MLAQRQSDRRGNALQPKVVFGTRLAALVIQRSHQVLNLRRAGCQRLNDTRRALPACGLHQVVEQHWIERQRDSFHRPFKPNRMPAALRHYPKRAGTNPLHTGEVRALDLRSHSRTGVQIEIMLLWLTLRKLRWPNRVVLHMQPPRSQARMPSYDIRHDRNDLRPLQH